MSARKRESTKKLKVSKTEIEKLSNNERMLNKKKENSFRIILPSKMAEIFAFKIWRKIFFWTLVCLAAAALRWHHHRKIKIKNFEKKNFFYFFFTFKKPNQKRIAVWLANHFKTIFIVLALKMAEIINF